MKKFFFTLLFALLAFSATAQERWSVGLRVGSAFQVDAQAHFNKQYLEARLGLGYINRYAYKVHVDEQIYLGYSQPLTADFSLFYNWKIHHWNINAGRVFFDAGVGLNIGGNADFLYVGPTGMAKIGFKFDNAPIALSLDWSPTFGGSIPYQHVYGRSTFNSMGLANFGVTCVYNF